MTANLHPNAARVQDALAAGGSTAQVRVLPDSAHTSAEAAAALDVAVQQIAKSLVFLADGQPVVIVLRGSDRLDPQRLARHLDATKVTKADAGVVRAATGFPIGGVSPVGHPPGLTVVIDRALGRHQVVWAAAGTPHAVFPTSFDELVALSGGTAGDVRAATD